MAGPKIKFRCYKCNQLLGVSRSRAAKVVACPKCSTDLIVPDLDDPPAPAGESPAPGTTPSLITAMDSGLPLELADIRPEDIRVASDDDWSALSIDVDAPRFAPDPDPDPEPEARAFLAPMAPASADGPAVPFEIETAPTPLSIPIAPITEPAASPVYVPASPGGSGVETVVPPIRFEPPSIIPERTTSVRSRDLILPRSVVATWSLLVLIAQATAFIAGLLVGHFLWRVH